MTPAIHREGLQIPSEGREISTGLTLREVSVDTPGAFTIGLDKTTAAYIRNYEYQAPDEQDVSFNATVTRDTIPMHGPHTGVSFEQDLYFSKYRIVFTGDELARHFANAHSVTVEILFANRSNYHADSLNPEHQSDLHDLLIIAHDSDGKEIEVKPLQRIFDESTALGEFIHRRYRELNMGLDAAKAAQDESYRSYCGELNRFAMAITIVGAELRDRQERL